MRRVFQFLVIFCLFWCFVSNEEIEDENAEPSADADADADPTDPDEPVTINIGAYCVIRIHLNCLLWNSVKRSDSKWGEKRWKIP